MKNIETRRSIRKYANKDVSSELLDRLLLQSARTQTMGNLQLYSVIVTRSAEMKAKLAPAHFNQPMVTQAPVVLTVCADFHRTSVWAENRKAQPGYNNFLSFINAATDTLQLPKLVMPVATITLGWPDEMPALSDRLEPSAFVHAETYHDYSAADIDRHYAAKESLEENKQFCEINEKETLAQIFTDIRYTKKDNEAMSEGMMNALRHQGFID